MNLIVRSSANEKGRKMETIILSIVFVVIVAFCYTLWKSALNEEKKEVGKLFR